MKTYKLSKDQSSRMKEALECLKRSWEEDLKENLTCYDDDELREVIEEIKELQEYLK